MIHWLTQSHTELPPTAAVIANGEYLNEEEHQRLLSLKTEKRRHDWLLGRWTAKRLLQTVIWEAHGVSLPLDLIAIGNDANGVPYCQPALDNCQWSISVSHSHGRAFVAVIEKPHASLGADMEYIQAHPASFAGAYFTEPEVALGRDLVGAKRAMWETAVWSAKEAVLKALHLGLSVDTRAISCLITPVDSLPQTWLPFTIRCDPARLPQPSPPLTGWWRGEDGFVLTLVTG